MKSTFFLDVVIWQSSAIFQLFASKDKPLLIWRNSFLVLNFSFNILYGVWRLNLKSDGFASESLHKNLHSSSETENKMKSTLFLDVVIWQSSTIFQLFASKNKPLLIWRNPFLVLNLGFNILYGVWGLNFKGDGLPSESLHKDLHSSSKTEN